jgi:hypothetical protein
LSSRLTLAVKEDATLDPIRMRLLGADADSNDEGIMKGCTWERMSIFIGD